MDIAFVSDVVHPFVTGGAQKRIHEIGRRLSAEGHQVTVYGRHWWEGSAEIEHAGMTLRGIGQPYDLYVDDRRSISEAIEFAATLLFRARRQLAGHDLVVASQFPYFPVIATKASTLFSDVPLVVTWHEVWGDYWEDYLGWLSFGGKLTERLTARLPHTPIAVSKNTADQLARLGPSRDDINVVPNGVDVDHIRSVPPATRGFDVLFVGRLIPEKNVEHLLCAFDRVAYDLDATLGIIGDGPKRDELERTAASLPSSERVHFLGSLEEHDDVLAHMRAAETFVCPSTREGFGITLIEAMAAGCTVVAVDHPRSAAREVVGEAGLLTDFSVDGIAETLSRAIDGEQPARDPEKWAQKYDWDQVTQQAEAVYRRAVRGGSPVEREAEDRRLVIE